EAAEDRGHAQLTGLEHVDVVDVVFERVEDFIDDAALSFPQVFTDADEAFVLTIDEAPVQKSIESEFYAVTLFCGPAGHPLLYQLLPAPESLPGSLLLVDFGKHDLRLGDERVPELRLIHPAVEDQGLDGRGLFARRENDEGAAESGVLVALDGLSHAGERRL